MKNKIITTKNNKKCPLSYFLFKLILYQFYIYFLIRKQTMSLVIMSLLKLKPETTRKLLVIIK